MKLTDITNPATNPLPEEVQDLVAALIEGRVHSLAILAEITDEDGDAAWITGFQLDMDDNESNDFAFSGALGILHRQVQDAIDTPTFEIELGDDDNDDDEND